MTGMLLTNSSLQVLSALHSGLSVDGIGGLPLAVGSSDNTLFVIALLVCGLGAGVWTYSNHSLKKRKLQTLASQSSDADFLRTALKDLRESESRYRALFDSVPVAVIEKDYTAVGKWLDDLRASGVRDILDYLRRHPGSLMAQYARVQVISSNRTALQRLDLMDATRVGGQTPPDHIAPQLLDVFQRELEALWLDRSSMTFTLDYMRSDGNMGHALLHWSAPSVDGWPDRRRGLLVFTDLSELRLAEEKLRVSEERPRLALQGFNVGIWEYNYATGESRFSDRWKKMLGFEVHEITDRKNEWLDRVHPEDKDAVRSAIDAHLRGEMPYYESEHRVRCKDGSHKWVLSRGQAVFDVLGRPSRMVGAQADISERKQAEAALRQSEERYRRLFEDNPTPMYVYDRTTKEFLAVNEAAVSHYGYSAKEFAGMTIQAILPPAESERQRGSVKAVLPMTSESGVKEHRRKDGSTVYMEISAHDHEFGGRPAVLVMATDITQRHMAEDSYRALFENAVEGICETTPEGKLVSVNPAFARMLSYANPMQMLACDYTVQRDLYVQADRRNQFFALLGKSDEMQDFESEVRRRDGSTIWISENVRAIRDSQGRLVRLQSFVSDVTARRSAAEALRMGEERLRHIVQQADCMLWQARVVDIQGILHWDCHVPASGLYLRLFEREKYDGGTMFWTPEMVPDLAEMERRSTLAIRGGDHEYHQEFRVRRHNQIMWMSEKVEITPIEPGEWLLVGVVVDVTSRRQAEEALRVSEARYRQLVEHSPLAILEIDISGVSKWVEELHAKGVKDLSEYIDANPEECIQRQSDTSVVGLNDAALKLLRASSLEEVSHHYANPKNDDLSRIRRNVLHALFEGRMEVDGDNSFTVLDGTLVRIVYHWWVPSVAGQPNLNGSQLVLVDLSDITRAENALATERERLSVTLRAMSEAVLTTDTNGVVQYINAAAEQMIGWNSTESVGRNLLDVCALQHARTQVPVVLPTMAELAQKLVADFPPQTALRMRSGSTLLVEGRYAALHGVDGVLLGAVLVLRDMTEKARLEAEQLRSSKLESLGILAGGIAHDFNNLLTVVMGNLTLAMLDTQVMSAAGRWLREAERGVLRARDLTQQLLTFAKGGDPVRTAVSLADVVRETAEFAMHGAKARCIFEFAPDLWPADVDKVQIGQVVQNIVINAVQAMPDGGLLRVSLLNENVRHGSSKALIPGAYLKLLIRDTGTGIPPDNLTRIFDPYFTTKPQGSGLGLATVYSIIKKHQGHIEVESIIGTGTTFRIWLPAAKRKPKVEAPVKTGTVSRSGRILFMDDEEPIRRLGMALLQSLGYETRVVPDGMTAFKEWEGARTQGRPFDLVMLDLTVAGGMGGLATLDLMRRSDPQVKAIVTSGYSSDPVLGDYRSHGFKGVVPKPYRINDLGRTIQAVLAGEET